MTQSNIPRFSTEHQTHRESLWRFLGLIVLLVAYFGYLCWKYDPATGVWLDSLSWSFFVLCTPIADGGFIIAFPVRLLFGTRMIITQLFVWVVAGAINAAALTFAPGTYGDTVLTGLLFKILTTPWPDWSILIISAAGTALSIWFGDEMMDVTTHAHRVQHHRHGFKYRMVLIVGLSLATILAYYHLLSELDIRLPAE